MHPYKNFSIENLQQNMTDQNFFLIKKKEVFQNQQNLQFSKIMTVKPNTSAFFSGSSNKKIIKAKNNSMN
jgi:hypothetical protein